MSKFQSSALFFTWAIAALLAWPTATWAQTPPKGETGKTVALHPLVLVKGGAEETESVQQQLEEELVRLGYRLVKRSAVEKALAHWAGKTCAGGEQTLRCLRALAKSTGAKEAMLFTASTHGRILVVSGRRASPTQVPVLQTAEYKWGDPRGPDELRLAFRRFLTEKMKLGPVKKIPGAPLTTAEASQLPIEPLTPPKGPSLPPGDSAKLPPASKVLVDKEPPSPPPETPQKLEPPKKVESPKKAGVHKKEEESKKDDAPKREQELPPQLVTKEMPPLMATEKAPEPRPSSSSSIGKPIGIGMMVGGGLLLATSGVLFAASNSKKKEFNDYSPGANVPASEQLRTLQDLKSAAKNRETMAWISGAAGILAAGGGFYLFQTSGRSGSLQLWGGPAGVGMSGRFP